MTTFIGTHESLAKGIRGHDRAYCGSRHAAVKDGTGPFDIISIRSAHDMTTPAVSLTSRPSWKALEAHHKKIREVHMRTLFSDDPQRGSRLTAEAAGLFLDYSKNRITDETLGLLFHLAEESGLRAR